MKSKFFLMIASVICFFSYIITHTILFAHPDILDVAYDACETIQVQDGEDGLWYLLYRPLSGYNEYRHLSEDVTTIRYYFSSYAKDNPDYTWTTDVSEDIANDIQNAFAKSLSKWNDVVFYTYDQNGNRTKKQLITVEEGTKENYNLLIYPIDATAPYIASTGPLGMGSVIDTHSPSLRHMHYDKWYMNVNVHYFYENQDVNARGVSINKERTGMHELGHVLGLRDVDVYCSSNHSHEDLLMGYGNGVDAQLDATYKDIAGVAITRGLHTDVDHVWMKRVNIDDTIDFICTICNGVVYDVESIEKQYDNYQDCVHYNGHSSHMLLVASSSNWDYLKCQRCRHIDTIELVEEYDLNGNIVTTSDTKIINSLSKMYYKLNVELFQHYEIIMNSYQTLHIKLYDENFEIVKPQIVEESDTTIDRIYPLSKGIYYLEIENAKSNKDILSLEIRSKNTTHLTLDCSNNILLNAYNGIYHYEYVHQNESGFYRFTLTGKRLDECAFLYSQNAVSIKESKNGPIYKKVPWEKESDFAQTKENENSIVVYLDKGKSFYLDIDIDMANVSLLCIDIHKIEETNIDLFCLSESKSETISLFEDDSISGDYMQSFVIHQTGQFILEIDYSSSQSSFLKFLLIKVNKDGTVITISSLQDEKYGLKEEKTYIYKETLNLEEGKYYIGYLQKCAISLTRIITQYGGYVLITDPDESTASGSQIQIAEKNLPLYQRSYRSTSILQGFTRIIYIDNHYIDETSRNQYEWYSSDEDIAIVSAYGTVLGKMPGKVKIMAVNKKNPSIVFIKSFTILEDKETSPVYLDIIDTCLSSSQQHYKINLSAQNCPYPMIQYYQWIVCIERCDTNDFAIILDKWGNVNISGKGEACLEGNYIYNTRFKIRIHILVV